MEKTLAKSDRYFTIVQGILICMPFLCLAYLKLGTGGAVLEAGGALAQSPAAAVTFLAAMVQPYVAFLLSLVQKRLGDERRPYALVMLGLLLAAEAMLMSSIGVVGLSLLTWRTCKAAQSNPLRALRQCRAGRLFSEVGGSILVLLVGALCLFASVRLGAIF